MPRSTTANITFRFPYFSRASSGLSFGSSSSGMLSSKAPICVIVGTLVSRASSTATRKSGAGGLDLRYAVEGFHTWYVIRNGGLGTETGSVGKLEGWDHDLPVSKGVRARAR